PATKPAAAPASRKASACPPAAKPATVPAHAATAATPHAYLMAIVGTKAERGSAFPTPEGWTAKKGRKIMRALGYGDLVRAPEKWTAEVENAMRAEMERQYPDLRKSA